MNIRTDIALESRDFFISTSKSKEIDGVIYEKKYVKKFEITKVKIINENGENILGKPIGKYITFDADRYIKRENNSFNDACCILKSILNDMLYNYDISSALIVGLGNKAITSDALGPIAAENVLITRHLIDNKIKYFEKMHRVSSVVPGVLASTGIETGEIVKAVSENIGASIIIVVDALASRSIKRICNTIQISNTGIIPGSGVGNYRNAINFETMGIPVIAIGVPTVVYANTLINDIASNANIEIDYNIISDYCDDLIFTPRDIDINVKDMGKLIGYGLNAALNNLSVNEITMYLE